MVLVLMESSVARAINSCQNRDELDDLKPAAAGKQPARTGERCMEKAQIASALSTAM